MYNELSTINKVASKKERVSLLLLFYREYSGLKNHLENLGKTWGFAGEECRAWNELNKVIDHLKRIEEFILNELGLVEIQ